MIIITLIDIALLLLLNCLFPFRHISTDKGPGAEKQQVTGVIACSCQKTGYSRDKVLLCIMDHNPCLTSYNP